MKVQELIKKYEERNSGRLKSYKATNNRDLLTLFVETEEFINDLKKLL